MAGFSHKLKMLYRYRHIGVLILRNIFLHPLKVLGAVRFRSDAYIQRNPDIARLGKKSFFHYLSMGINENRKMRGAPSHKIKYVNQPSVFDWEGVLDPNYLQDLQKVDRLHVFFNISRDMIGGGMLSIERFTRLSNDFFSDNGNTKTIMSGLPLSCPPLHYSMFKTALPMVHFDWICTHTNPKEIVLFIPEGFVAQFLEETSSAHIDWILSRAHVKCVILNQNNDLMPKPTDFRAGLESLTKDITISTAHKRYCTQQLANDYMYDVTLLTPLLPDMAQLSFEEKDDVILVSPDPLASHVEETTKEKILDQIAARFPHLKQKVVENMSLAKYLDLASRAKYSITFGEGLDGYFIEPVLAKGVAFSVFNGTFFPSSFRKLSSICPDWESFADFVCYHIEHTDKNSLAYRSLSDAAAKEISKLYSLEITLSNMRNLLHGEPKFTPQPYLHRLEEFEDIKNSLRETHGFRFIDARRHNPIAFCPDGQFLRYFENTDHSELTRTYVWEDYDLKLKPNQTYVVLDIGANIGATSCYLNKKHPNIAFTYCYEAIWDIAKLAQMNLEANVDREKYLLKSLVLSDSYCAEHTSPILGSSEIFSDRQIQPTFETETQAGTPSRRTEINYVKALDEFDEVFDSHLDAHFVIKHNYQGDGTVLITELLQSRLLKRLAALVVKVHAENPTSIIQSFEIRGFSVTVDLDEETENVYTLKVARDVGVGW